MSRNNLINEAIAEAKAVREAALENAKSMIVDAFTPQLKNKINDELNEEVATEGDQPSGYDSGGHESQKGEDMLSKGDGSAVYEDDTTVEGDDVAEDVDEDVYEIALDEGEDEEGEEEEDEGEEEMPVEESAEVTAENVQSYIHALQNENAAYAKAIKQLQKEFNEVNLFNSKLIYANKVLRTPGLTKDQKYGIVEQFDNAHTIGEVKIIYTSLTEGVKIGSAVNKKPAHKSSAPIQKTASGKNHINEDFDRMQELSGLLND